MIIVKHIHEITNKVNKVKGIHHCNLCSLSRLTISRDVPTVVDTVEIITTQEKYPPLNQNNHHYHLQIYLKLMKFKAM